MRICSRIHSQHTVLKHKHILRCVSMGIFLPFLQRFLFGSVCDKALLKRSLLLIERILARNTRLILTNYCVITTSLKIIMIMLIIVNTITSISVILEILRMDTSVEYLLYSITLIYPMSFSPVAGIIQSRYSIVVDFDLRFFANSELYGHIFILLTHTCDTFLIILETPGNEP